LGENELGSTQFYDNNYRNPQNRAFDKRIMTFGRTHVFKSNGIYQLPIGRSRLLLKNTNRLLDGIVGGWLVSGILTYTSGQPFTVTAPVSTFSQFTTGQTPDVMGALPKSTGLLQFDGRGACFLCGFKQIADPSIGLLAPSIASRSTLIAWVAPNGPYCRIHCPVRWDRWLRRSSPVRTFSTWMRASPRPSASLNGSTSISVPIG
jgi:hypothetical protein